MELFDEFASVMDGYVDVVGVGEDLGSQNGPLISPVVYRKLIKPRQKNSTDLLRAK